MAERKIKAVVFDVFGTVVDWRNSIAKEAKALLHLRNANINWHLFADSWRLKYHPSMEKIRNGTRNFVPLDVLHYENLQEVLAEYEITDLTETELDHLNKAWHRLDPWPDSVPGLSRLKQKFIIGTMSNGNVSLMVNMAKYGGLRT